jgi:hypothetical protein
VIEHAHLDPTVVEDVDFSVQAEISSFAAELDPEGVVLKYRIGRPGLWIPTPMVDLGGGIWQGIIPGQRQPAEISYYIVASDLEDNQAVLPLGGATDPYRFDVAWIAETFSSTDGGFIVDPDGTDNADEPGEGVWDRAVPGEEELEPYGDHSTDGVYCWLTHDGEVQGTNNWSRWTTLQTPVYPLAGAYAAKVKYWRWFAAVGTNAQLRVQVRNDGGEWIEIENTIETEASWRQIEFDLYAEYGDDLGDVEVRFTARDSVMTDRGVEVAIDDFVVLADFSSPDDVVEELSNPRVSLHRPIPNPFTRSTDIRFEIPRRTEVTLAIHDASGRLIRRLLDHRSFNAGQHSVPWDGRTHSGVPARSGVYYLQLRTEDRQETRGIILLK